jgi:uncharacterized ferritin-like protein (DUF455 family)
LAIFPIVESNVDLKIRSLESSVSNALRLESRTEIPIIPGRDVSVLELTLHPEKKGLSSKEGQARLVHDLASIELQAMELALRTLLEFPEAPLEFRQPLAELVLSEGEHLRLCLHTIRELGFEWGDWPVHLGLWQCVSTQDTLLDRLLIVHRYLEGSGLDAGATLVNRLSGVPNNAVKDVVKTIMKEEVDHVQFGSHWYRKFCSFEGVDPDHDFKFRFERLKNILPRRLERIVPEIRLKAGFSLFEIDVLQNHRSDMLNQTALK